MRLVVSYAILVAACAGATTGACGSVTWNGRCNGNVVEYCANGSPSNAHTCTTSTGAGCQYTCAQYGYGAGQCVQGARHTVGALARRGDGRPGPRRRRPAERAVRIGSADDNDLVPRDRGVSRHHLTIELGELGERGARVRDLDSKNGTWYRGSRLEAADLPRPARMGRVYDL